MSKSRIILDHALEILKAHDCIEPIGGDNWLCRCVTWVQGDWEIVLRVPFEFPHSVLAGSRRYDRQPYGMDIYKQGQTIFGARWESGGEPDITLVTTAWHKDFLALK
jgi:hypothetical protein